MAACWPENSLHYEGLSWHGNRPPSDRVMKERERKRESQRGHLQGRSCGVTYHHFCLILCVLQTIQSNVGRNYSRMWIPSGGDCYRPNQRLATTYGFCIWRPFSQVGNQSIKKEQVKEIIEQHICEISMTNRQLSLQKLLIWLKFSLGGTLTAKVERKPYSVC